MEELNTNRYLDLIFGSSGFSWDYEFFSCDIDDYDTRIGFDLSYDKILRYLKSHSKKELDFQRAHVQTVYW